MAGITTSHEELRALFAELSALEPAARAARCASLNLAPEVREELESLLAYDTTQTGSLTGLVGGAAEQFLLSSTPTNGGYCGPYRLVRLLGNGGMGAVYLGERVDGELDQQVAIKFVRTGADLPRIKERFLRERQILASLNHPGIARLFDVGHAQGQPYLVMEYVNGTRIDEYAAKRGEREVLELFIRAAEAVAYAHRNLVIHRDLKPSNILVDALGQPKLLDFGIAKILDSDDDTQTLERMMTPGYSSPEQCQGAPQATTTDVYSLGAVLYRLLTGEKPVTRALPAGVELSPDLEAILAKAMREEPEERYASVEQLIADIRAYLEYRPVTARRGNAFYHIRKFARRRWIPITAVALAVVGITGGVLLSERQRGLAQQRLEQVRQVSRQLLELDNEMRALPGATKARQRIVSTSLETLERLMEEARRARWRPVTAADRDLTLDVAAAYLRVAQLQGVPSQPNLGQFEAAWKSLERAEAIASEVRGQATAVQLRRIRLLTMRIALDEMIITDSLRREAEAARHGARAAAIVEELTKEPLAPEAAMRVTEGLINLALNAQRQDNLPAAMAYARRAAALGRPLESNHRNMGYALSILANSARFAGDFDTALKAIRESRVYVDRIPSEQVVDRTLAHSAVLWREGVILGELNSINLGRVEEAARLLRQAYDLAEGLCAKDPDDFTSRLYLSMAGRELGDVLRESAPSEALAIYEHTFRRLQEMPNNRKARNDEVWLLTGASYALRKLGRPAEAQRRLDQAVARLRQAKGWDAKTVDLGGELDVTLRAIGDHQAATGQLAAAIATYEDLQRRVLARHVEPERKLRSANGVGRLYRDLAAIYRRAGEVEKAAALEAKRLALWRHWDRQLPNNPFIQKQLL